MWKRMMYVFLISTMLGRIFLPLLNGEASTDTIIYRAPGVANGINHFLLHAAVHPGLHCTELAG